MEVSGRSNAGDGSNEAVFAMDPEATVWTLARQLVDGQRTLARIKLAAETADTLGPTMAEQTRELRTNMADLEKQWYRQTLPMLLASVQLAVEVFDTFGPGLTRIDDPIEAAIWNNKHHVWVKELGG